MLRLSQLDRYPLPEERLDDLGAFDYLLCLGDFRQSPEDKHEGRWPWPECYSNATSDLRMKRIVAKVLQDASKP
jgi:hypothetical protein